MRDFVEGDWVTFELSERNPSFPRWDFGRDRGGSGIFVAAQVQYAGPSEFKTKKTKKTKDASIVFPWIWPQPSYRPETYEPPRPGYVAHDGYVEEDTKMACSDICDLHTIMRGEGHDPRCSEGQTFTEYRHDSHDDG